MRYFLVILALSVSVIPANSFAEGLGLRTPLDLKFAHADVHFEDVQSPSKPSSYWGSQEPAAVPDSQPLTDLFSGIFIGNCRLLVRKRTKVNCVRRW